MCGAQVLFVLSALCVSKGLAFNLDPKHPIILSGRSGGYFGYSVAFHSNREGELALVTAPRDDFTLYNGTVDRPGVLYKCSTTSHNCDQVLLERTGNTFHADGTDLSYHDLKNNSWLGVSLDVQEKEPGYVVTCSHLWKNQVYPSHYLVNGVCYVLDRELFWSSTAKLLPLLDRRKQSIIPPGIYNYALGQAGASVTFSEDGKDLIMGAPGFYDWIGTVVEYKVPSHLRQFGRPVVPNPPFNQQVAPEAYLGYSVTTGHFFELAGMSYVAGAPRDAGNNGRVYIFEQLSTTKSKIIVQQKIEGGQLGEYFGATLLSLDLTDNGYSDLLVGAPLYSLKGGGDEGRVYVLLSDGVGLQLQKDLFVGSSVPYSRFGTAIAKAGDLNQDGFQDVVIGAPYENQVGAVYIYHGSRAGLRPQFSQKIMASDLDSSLRGFGISVARSKDIDNNKYPDLLVGAYSSDKAVILKSHPIVKFQARLDFDVKQVDLNDTRCEVKGRKVTCFNVQACLKATGKHIPQVLGTLVELWADVSETQQGLGFSSSRGGYHQPRGQFMQEGQPGAVPRMTTGLVLQRDRETCIDARVQVLPEDVTDIIQPMTFQMNFSLQVDEKEDKFCASCPVLDPSLPTSLTKQIYFRTGCGEDNTCSADLKVQAHILGLGKSREDDDEEEAELIHGANNTISLEVRVENTGEPAYATLASVSLPPGVGVINQGKCLLTEDRDRGNSTLDCKMGNPLRKGQPAVFQVKLDISKLDYRLPELVIKIVSSTSSQEMTPRDNAMLLRVPIRALADITIRGYADREQIEYQPNAEPIPLLHTYLVLKYYPSPVHSVGVAISVPLFDRATRVQILELESVQVGVGQSASVPGSCNVSGLATTADALEEQERSLNKGGKDAPNTINLIGQLGRSKDGGERSSPFQLLPPENLQEGGGSSPPEELTIQAQVKDRRSSYIMNCGNSLCQTLICSVGPFLDNSKVASIQVKGLFNVTAANYALGNQVNVSLVTGGRVWIQDYDYDPQPFDHRPDADEVSTDFIMAQQPAKPVEVWIIILAVLVGLLLLAIILFVLYKLGFFRRAEKEEMDRMMQKGALLQPGADDSPADKPEPENESCAKEADEFDYINFANANT